MSVKTVRRLAARLLKCGKSRVRIIDPKRASDALTSDDVRELIKEKVVFEVPSHGVSRGKARRKQERKRKGRRRGRGSQSGSAHARVTAKELWMRKVRAQRKLLKASKRKVSGAVFREAYRMIKGNAFPDKKRLAEYLKSKEENSEGVKVG
ncbi:MAG: 50S ribosomal protein L19e [Candidatus Micrarchaeota archaeon]